jgi:DNA polymerase-1
MDTLQLVSGEKIRVYTLKKGIKDTIIYNEDKVNERYGFGPEFLPDYKGLRGDPSDNIPGIKGVGEKTATDLIKNFGHIEDIYKALKKDKKQFEKVGIKERIIKLLEEGEEEANFSKMLGTVNRSAPIDFEVPEKTWKEGLDIEKINSVWTDMEFRTLSGRLKDILSPKSKVESHKVDAEGRKEVIKKEEYYSGQNDKIKELSVMLWLINSNITNPTAEDIYNFTKVKDIKEAESIITKNWKKEIC